MRLFPPPPRARSDVPTAPTACAAQGWSSGAPPFSITLYLGVQNPRKPSGQLVALHTVWRLEVLPAHGLWPAESTPACCLRSPKERSLPAPSEFDKSPQVAKLATICPAVEISLWRSVRADQPSTSGGTSDCPEQGMEHLPGLGGSSRMKVASV